MLNWQAAKKAGCVAYLDSQGIYHFVNDVNEKDQLYEGEYRNYLWLYNGNDARVKSAAIIVHEGVTVNLRGLCSSYLKLKIELQKDSKLVINFDEAPKVAYTKDYATDPDYAEYIYRAIKVNRDLEITGDGTLEINSGKEFYDADYGGSGIYASDISINGSVSLDIDTVSQQGAYAISSPGIISIDTTGYVKVNKMTFPGGERTSAISCEKLDIKTASYVEISSSYPSGTSGTEFGLLINDEDYKTLNRSAYPGWDIETNGSAKPLTVDTVYRQSYVKFERNDIGRMTLTLMDGTVIESLKKGTVKTGEYGRVLDISASASEWLTKLSKDSRVSFKESVQIIKNDKRLMSSEYAKYIAAQKFPNGTSMLYVTVELNELPKEGDVYSISVYITPVLWGTAAKFQEPAFGSWTLTAKKQENNPTEKKKISDVELIQGGKLTTATPNPTISVLSGMPYTITNAGNWSTPDANGKSTRTITLSLRKEVEKYCLFVGQAEVSVRGDGREATTASKGSTRDSKNLTTTLTTYKYHKISFKNYEDDSNPTVQYVKAGDKVVTPAFTGKAADGQIFSGWSTGGSTAAIYKALNAFTPITDMTLTAAFEASSTNPPEGSNPETINPGSDDPNGKGDGSTGSFTDVLAGDYYADAVKWAVDKGITKGTDDTHFSPNGICTRAQAVTFLQQVH